MDRIDVFEDIARTVTEDFAGAEELAAAGTGESAAAQIGTSFMSFATALEQNHMLENEQFFDLVQLYLAVLDIPAVQFEMEPKPGFSPYYRGFHVRSDGSDLYVTDVVEDGLQDELHPGEKIVKVNQYDPAEYRSVTAQYKIVRPLSDRDGWDAFLNHAVSITVERADGHADKVALRKFPVQPVKTTFTCDHIATLGQSIAYLRIDDFLDGESLFSLIAGSRHELESADGIIIDLRHNVGGVDEVASLLLPWVCPTDISTDEFLGFGAMYTRYSARNCIRVIDRLRPFLDSDDDEVCDMARTTMEGFRSKWGKGFVRDAVEPDGIAVPCHAHAKDVVVLCDTATSGLAESFALGCRRVAGAKLIGRPTEGTLDYGNYLTFDYGFGRMLTYPISKTAVAMRGEGFAHRGIPMDIHVPWTSGEITEDLILKRAVQELEQKYR